ncbi:MAG: ATP-binding cassette domain-containing protein [Alphaproteobacteria bacterium]|nr:ATP-binding cassette domain-containing protein [Alphaproteobacteria bacterium]
MILQVDQLAKRFPGGVKAVADVSFTAGAGELVALVGESGCGKTTTLKCINRLHEPSAGRVLIEDEDIQGLDPVAQRRRIGWVMQGDGLFPHMSAAANIAVGPRLLGWEAGRIAARVDELLELVRLDPAIYRDRLPRQLSGGQRQRIGVARALAAGPHLVLMDEPFGALDPITRDGLRADFSELQARLKFAAVMVTHDMAEALLMADRIAVMEAGRILQYDTPSALLAAPAGETVARMLESPLREAERVGALKAGAAQNG